ncbi:MAG TPA: MFS transporter [Ilumatobacteraceae bacterium]|nr:MFS transporter [Ilumatobacteraceae bacterium]
MTDGSLWRNRDFRLVLGGGLVNNIGDWLLILALPIFVFTESGSGRNAAAVFLVELIVGVFLGPYGGSLADRWDLRRTIIATNLLQAVTLLPLLAVQRDRLWPAFVVAAAQAVLQQVNDPASFALVPRVVSDAQLVQANAANSTASSLARLVGAPLGGIAVGLGGLTTVVVIDVASFVAVAVATTFVRTPTSSLLAGAPAGEDRSSTVMAGVREIRGRPALVGFLVVQALARVAFAMFPVLFIKFVVVELQGGGAAIGVIRGCAAFGGFAASLLVIRVAKRTHPETLMMWGYLSFALVAALFINAPLVTRAIWLYLVLFALSGLPNATSQIGTSATAQHLCPPEVLGRLSGVASATGAIGAAIGTVGVGLLVDHIRIIPLFNVQAVVYLLCGVATYALIARRAPAAAAVPPDIPMQEPTSSWVELGSED